MNDYCFLRVESVDGDPPNRQYTIGAVVLRKSPSLHKVLDVYTPTTPSTCEEDLAILLSALEDVCGQKIKPYMEEEDGELPPYDLSCRRINDT